MVVCVVFDIGLFWDSFVIVVFVGVFGIICGRKKFRVIVVYRVSMNRLSFWSMYFICCFFLCV